MNNIIVPNHIGIIMDGNRRWAKEKKKKTIEGHLAGANRIISLAKYIFDKGVKYLSIYAFSTENFNRSAEEVSYLMGLIIKFFNERVNELHDYNIKIVVSGLRDNLSKEVLKCIDNVVDLTKDNTGGVLNVCLNYGGRREIVDAVNKIKEANVSITEETFGKYLYNDLPDLDYVIRTSGEERISNFMLWQISYAEFYFPKVYFPDFDEKEFDKALEIYNNRNRRFGGN
ncbi:MAG: di-trans,poly-cis-decaprenylcistransferase [Clostridiaceae bacterium]|mgnify:FL=1|nr:MAG: di-trans,poly-cis-decaprenylcistransferase [Clostridiaceae bacterium]